MTCAGVAFLIRELLDRLKLKAFPKVSGSKDILVYIALNTAASYDVTQAFARAVADLLTDEYPKLVVADTSKALHETEAESRSPLQPSGSAPWAPHC